MNSLRQITPLDHLLTEAQRALDTVFGNPPAHRPYPAEATPDVELNADERRHAAGLMRINHVGEVCAQGLYFGQAAVAREPETRAHLLEAAQEETDHLAWCAQRLRELDSRPSLFNPLWYAGSYTIGTLAGLRGDGWNLGFVVETERQVEAHLDEHLDTLPPADLRRHVRHGRRASSAATDSERDGAGLEGDEGRGIPVVMNGSKTARCLHTRPSAWISVERRICATRRSTKLLTRTDCARGTALRSRA